MTRVNLGPSPRDSYPPACPEVLDAAMVIFGAAVAARFDGNRLPLDEPTLTELARAVSVVVTSTGLAIQEATRQQLPMISATLKAGGHLVISWVVG